MNTYKQVRIKIPRNITQFALPFHAQSYKLNTIKNLINPHSLSRTSLNPDYKCNLYICYPLDSTALAVEGSSKDSEDEDGRDGGEPKMKLSEAEDQSNNLNTFIK
jgi:hypothetical protein